ncbi:MAG: M1 family metallopeptidase [Acidobacteriota bacterium]
MFLARFTGCCAGFLLVGLVTLWPVALAQRTAPETLPVRWTRINDFDTQHLALDLRFDWSTETVHGTAQLTFKPIRSDFRRLTLDAGRPLTIFNVATESGVKLDFQHDKAAEKLIIALDRGYGRNDMVKLDITYQAHSMPPTGGLFGMFGTGLTFLRPTSAAFKGRHQIWSQGETEYNRNWFPCFDFPNDKFTSEVRARVERPYTVVSNGRLVSDVDNGDGTHTVHWRMEQPHASYLLSVAIGEYRVITGEHDGVPVQSYVYPDRYADAQRAFANLSRMMAFFSTATGIRYPYAKYAQTMIAEFGGGMENITTTHLADHLLPRAHERLDDIEALQAHELAHQWFGNLVTCRDWSEIWLSEGFATYFEALYMGQRFGPARLRSILAEHHATYHQAWNEGRRRPIVTRQFIHPDQLFDTYAYSRGALVLDMLRFVIGDEAWHEGIKNYLQRHQFQNVETSDFRRAMEEASGMGLDWFFDQWVYRMGHPVFEVTYTYNASRRQITVKVKQVQKTETAFKHRQTDYFRTPVEVEIVSAEGDSQTVRWLVEAEAEQEFSLPLDAAPRAVHFDPHHRLIREVIGETAATKPVQGVLGAGWMFCRHQHQPGMAASAVIYQRCNPLMSRVVFPHRHSSTARIKSYERTNVTR